MPHLNILLKGGIFAPNLLSFCFNCRSFASRFSAKFGCHLSIKM